MRTCALGRPRDVCRYRGTREVRRKVLVKGRWVSGRRQVRGFVGNRYVHQPLKWVLYKVPRTRVKVSLVDVVCEKKRLGKGNFGDLCVKHARMLAAKQLREARGAVSRAGRELAAAKHQLVARKAESTRLEQQVTKRRHT